MRIIAYRYTKWGLKITDTDSNRIEDQSKKVFISILETFEKAKQRRLKFEERDRRYELECIEMERIQKEREIEQKKREQLETAAESFTKSKYIYQFIEEIKQQKHKLKLTNDEEAKFDEWLLWANEHAERLNPTVQTIDTILNDQPRISV